MKSQRQEQRKWQGSWVQLAALLPIPRARARMAIRYAILNIPIKKCPGRNPRRRFLKIGRRSRLTQVESHQPRRMPKGPSRMPRRTHLPWIPAKEMSTSSSRKPKASRRPRSRRKRSLPNQYHKRMPGARTPVLRNSRTYLLHWAPLLWC